MSPVKRTLCALLLLGIASPAAASLRHKRVTATWDHAGMVLVRRDKHVRPKHPATHPVKSRGPVTSQDDSDGDGIIDRNDLCPQLAEGTHPDVQLPGCPLKDSDQDGLFDSVDMCPQVAAGAHPDPDHPGCPAGDRDHDGVYDSEDVCPDVAAGIRSDSSRPGCPSDRDGDMVADTEDACPDEFGTADADPSHNGCPNLQLVHPTDAVILQPIFFLAGSDRLRPASAAGLPILADTLRRSRAIRHLFLEGYTDSQQGPDTMALAIKRAETVKRWLIAHGVEPDRLDVIGFGSWRPVAAESTAWGRAENNRVELRVVQANLTASLAELP